MRVKIGDEWFEAELGKPIAIELTEKDKANIANMHPEATRYAVFAELDIDVEDARAWIKA